MKVNIIRGVRIKVPLLIEFLVGIKHLLASLEFIFTGMH